MRTPFHKIVGLCIGVGILLFFLGNTCPIEHIVGIPCPGCNMFSALYWLFVKGNLSIAQYYHPALLPLLVYVVCLLGLYLRYREKLTQTKLFRICSLLFLMIFIGIYVIRMLTIFPDIPMSFNEDAILPRLFHLF